MYKFKLVDESGEETIVKSDSRDVLQWEKSSKDDETYRDLLTGISMTRLYRLAHIAAKREGVFTGPLKDFESRYVLILETEEVRPTSAGVSSET